MIKQNVSDLDLVLLRLVCLFFSCLNHLGKSDVFDDLDVLAAGTKSKTSHHRSPGGERRKKRKLEMVFSERTREGRRQSDQH